MSKAEELANAITCYARFGHETEEQAKLRRFHGNKEAAAHLRALDASHRQLLEALEAFVEYDDCDTDEGIEMMHLYNVAIALSRTAIAAAKELT